MLLCEKFVVSRPLHTIDKYRIHLLFSSAWLVLYTGFINYAGMETAHELTLFTLVSPCDRLTLDCLMPVCLKILLAHSEFGQGRCLLPRWYPVIPEINCTEPKCMLCLLTTVCFQTVLLLYMSLVMRKHVFGVCNQLRLEPAYSATEAS